MRRKILTTLTLFILSFFAANAQQYYRVDKNTTILSRDKSIINWDENYIIEVIDSEIYWGRDTIDYKKRGSESNVDPLFTLKRNRISFIHNLLDSTWIIHNKLDETHDLTYKNGNAISTGYSVFAADESCLPLFYNDRVTINYSGKSKVIDGKIPLFYNFESLLPIESEIKRGVDSLAIKEFIENDTIYSYMDTELISVSKDTLLSKFVTNPALLYFKSDNDYLIFNKNNIKDKKAPLSFSLFVIIGLFAVAIVSFILYRKLGGKKNEKTHKKSNETPKKTDAEETALPLPVRLEKILSNIQHPDIKKAQEEILAIFTQIETNKIEEINRIKEENEAAIHTAENAAKEEIERKYQTIIESKSEEIKRKGIEISSLKNYIKEENDKIISQKNKEIEVQNLNHQTEIRKKDNQIKDIEEQRDKIAKEKDEHYKKELDGKDRVINKQKEDKEKEIKEIITRKDKESQRYRDNVIFADELKPYAKKTLKLMDMANLLQKEYARVYKKEKEKGNSENSSLCDKAFAKFQFDTYTLNIGDWREQLHTIVNNGVLVIPTKENENSYSAVYATIRHILESAPDKRAEEFQKAISIVLLNSYGSAILVLIENIMLLAEYGISVPSPIKELRNTIRIHLAKELELEINDILLLASSLNNSGIKVVDKIPTTLKNIPENSVIEILSYGIDRKGTSVPLTQIITSI
ncbi:MAG: hypothetical protein LBR46_05285 [Prevotella sp.]|nr:hypothetical protein [Prevotella sp.]